MLDNILSEDFLAEDVLPEDLLFYEDLTSLTAAIEDSTETLTERSVISLSAEAETISVEDVVSNIQQVTPAIDVSDLRNTVNELFLAVETHRVNYTGAAMATRTSDAQSDAQTLISTAENIAKPLLKSTKGVSACGCSLCCSKYPANPLSATLEEALSTTGITALSNTFKLHSNPNAKYTIYLDFDGHVTTGTSWNTAPDGTFYSTITSEAYDIGGDGLAFSNAELATFQRIWQRVAEDFAPFEVNVTTEDPGTNALKKEDGDDRWGIRVVLTQDNAVEGRRIGGGGRAYYHSFVDDIDTPAFSFNGVSAEISASTISHEVGHSLGLYHDGFPLNEDYYGGHGFGDTAWQTLMGGPNQRGGVSQWSKGEYTGANNDQDDLAQISSYISYKADDASDLRATSKFLNAAGQTSFQAYGLIEKNTDVDIFSFMTGAGNISLDVKAATRFYLNGNATDIQGEGSNLDIWAGLYNAFGELVAEANPEQSLEASFSNIAVEAGKYYLHVDGVGVGDPMANNPTGYTDYGSLGQYFVEGAVIATDTNNLVSIEATDAIHLEGDSGSKRYTFTVTRTGELSGTTTVDWQYSGQGSKPASASDVNDRVFSGTVTFAAGETSKTLSIDIAGDIETEPTEDFIIRLKNLTSTAGTFQLGAAAAFGTIISDDAEIEGVLWNDLNENGIREADERGRLSGLTVFVDSNKNGQLDVGEAHQVTDAQGQYAFYGLNSGTYNLSAIVPQSYQYTSKNKPINTEVYQIDDGDFERAGGWNSGDLLTFNTFEAKAGKETLNYISVLKSNFGNAKKVFLYQDQNGDKRPQSNERILEKDLQLSGSGEFEAISIDPTNVTGTFFVGALYEGNNDTLTQIYMDDSASSGTNPSAQTWVYYNRDNPEIPIDINSFSAQRTFNDLRFGLRAHSGIVPQTFNLKAGQAVSDADFGFSAGSPVNISGRLWSDLNGNGQQDDGEASLQQWRVFIDANGNQSFDSTEVSTFTNAEGDYQFGHLFAGEHRVAAVLKTGYTPRSFAPKTITLAAGEVRTGVNFTVANGNSAPTVENPIADQTLTVDEAFTLTFPTSVFADANNDRLTYRVSGLPDGFSFNASTRTITGTPTAALASKNFTVDITADDGLGGTVTDSFLLQVAGPPVPPAPPTGLQFTLDKTTAQVGDTITLVNAQVMDANGIGDLNRVDFWLKGPDGIWQDKADVTSFTGTGETANFNYSMDLTGLAAGSYTLWARAYDQAGTTSDPVVQTFEIASANTAPTDLRFDVDKTNYAPGDTLTLTNAQVTDAQGANTLDRVDLWLKGNDGVWQDLSDVTTFGTNGEFNYSLSLSDFEAGDYTLWAMAYDQSGETSNSLQKSFSISAGNTAPTDLRFDVNVTGSAITLSNAQVSDADGAANIAEVDIWLKGPDDIWLNLSDEKEFQPTNSTTAQFSYDVLSTGAAGTYTVWARAVDAAGAYSNSYTQTFDVLLGGGAPSAVVTGTEGVDTFVLGTPTDVLYNAQGAADYALIRGLNLASDRIQIKGTASEYRIGAATQGAAIYATSSGTDELIGLVEGHSSMDLDDLTLATHFTFV